MSTAMYLPHTGCAEIHYSNLSFKTGTSHEQVETPASVSNPLVVCSRLDEGCVWCSMLKGVVQLTAVAIYHIIAVLAVVVKRPVYDSLEVQHSRHYT